MITFKEFRALEERAERLELSKLLRLKIIIDPKEVELRSMLNRAKLKELRGLIDQKTMIIWDSFKAIHKRVTEMLIDQLKVSGNFMHIYIKLSHKDKIRLLVSAGGGKWQPTTSLARKWPWLTFLGPND